MKDCSGTDESSAAKPYATFIQDVGSLTHFPSREFTPSDACALRLAYHLAELFPSSPPAAASEKPSPKDKRPDQPAASAPDRSRPGAAADNKAGVGDKPGKLSAAEQRMRDLANKSGAAEAGPLDRSRQTFTVRSSCCGAAGKPGAAAPAPKLSAAEQRMKALSEGKDGGSKSAAAGSFFGRGGAAVQDVIGCFFLLPFRACARACTWEQASYFGRALIRCLFLSRTEGTGKEGVGSGLVQEAGAVTHIHVFARRQERRG